MGEVSVNPVLVASAQPCESQVGEAWLGAGQDFSSMHPWDGELRRTDPSSSVSFPDPQNASFCGK